MIRIWKMMNRRRLVIITLLIFLEAFGFLVLPTLAAEILNTATLETGAETIRNIGAIMVAVTLAAIVIGIFSTRLSAQESQGLGNTLRKKLFEKIMSFSGQEMSNFGTSTLITRTTNDVMQIQLVTMIMLRLIIMSPVVMIVSFFFAYQREAQLAWVFAITLPLIAVGVGLILKKASPIFRSIQKKTDRLNQIFREGLTGMRVIRAFNTTGYEEERFDEANVDFRDTSIRANTTLALMLPVMIIVMGISNMLIFTQGTQLIASGLMDIGNLIAFIQYGVQILISVLQVAMLFFFLPRAEVSAERILEVLDMDLHIEDPVTAESLDDADQVFLELRDVGFGFKGAERDAVCDIHIEAKPGDTLAIIGGTGSGKTTIANLISRLYEATSGQVLLNGIDIRSLTQKELRENIGFAPQQAILFSGTIRSNLQYGNPQADDEDMWHALSIAQADFVENLDQRVEAGGRNFSGGQRQRLSIARALVSRPNIYIFDDSFSALDFKTDAKLRVALEPETEDAILIIIAQRVNTVMDADEILVLDSGRIVGRGSHEELLETNALYQDIVSSQMKGAGE